MVHWLKWSEKVIYEGFEHIGEKRTLLSNILRRKAVWIRNSLRKWPFS